MSSVPKNTVSRCSTKTVRGTHSFEINGTFTVGGFDWAIRFYPDGLTQEYQSYVSFDLELITKSKAWALYRLSLINQVSGVKETVFSATAPRMFTSCQRLQEPLGLIFPARFQVPHAAAFVKRSKLELSSAGYIMNDCLTIQCDLVVLMDTQVWKPKAHNLGEIPVPPSDLSDHFRKLWLDEETADVKFIVDGDALPAHKLVLAAPSPVLKAELHGQMREGTERRVFVEDMRPDVFKALLHFVYTDDLPEWEDLDDAQYCEIVRRLLVAADRYAMDRPKQVCASILQQFLAVENVASILAFADHNNCRSLRGCLHRVYGRYGVHGWCDGDPGLF